MFDGTLKIAITENGTSSKAKQRSVFLFESMILFAKREVFLIVQIPFLRL